MLAPALALLLSAAPVSMDKIAHASVSANLVLGAAAVAHVLGLPHPALIAAGFALMVGLLKELVWDLALARGTPDPMDMAANAVGTAAGTVTVILLINTY